MNNHIDFIFFCIDEFCKIYKIWEKHNLISTGRERFRDCRMSLSERLTIAILYHFLGHKNFKLFYHEFVLKRPDLFPKPLSYNRFVELMPRLSLPLCALIHHLKGEIMSVKLTKGNVDDRSPVEELVAGLEGKIFADKGYISKDLWQKLWAKSMQLFHGVKKNMRNYLIDIKDKILLRKRSLIETIFGVMKKKYGPRAHTPQITEKLRRKRAVMRGRLSI